MKRVVHETVASPEGAAVDNSSEVYNNLVHAIDTARDTRFPVLIDSYRPRTFPLKLKVRYREKTDRERTLKRIIETLQWAFSFRQRNFGQPVTESEILSLVQTIEGVEAVLVRELDGRGGGRRSVFWYPGPQLQIAANIASFVSDETSQKIEPAELLTLSPDFGKDCIEEMRDEPVYC
jgi:hypothetical protein